MMRMKRMMRLLILTSLVTQLSFAAMTSLTEAEKAEINQRLLLFYRTDHPAEVMNFPSHKFGVHSGKRAYPNAYLRTKQPSQGNALWDQAQVKATDQFQQYYCEHFLDKHFPDLHCKERLAGEETRSWSNVQGDDLAEVLADTWTDVIYNLDQLPIAGLVSKDIWSDDYWRMRWGLTSFRYSEHNSEHEFKTYKEAVNSYRQPQDWLSLVSLSIEAMAKKILKWSPAEKYDVMTGDTRFTLTNEQKNEGKNNLGRDGNVEDWMGICHGWAPAALIAERPKKSVTLMGAKGVPVEFYPNDIKALITLAWANGNYPANNAGGRCDVKKPQTFPNGRLKQQQCFDTNPATFHLALANLIGRNKTGFIIDKTFDFEVWNQPVLSYEFSYFNPLKPANRSRNWREVMVPYDRNFKARDRFQRPLTRGDMKHPGPNQDQRIKNVVGVITTIVYASEVTPEHSPEIQPDQLLRETYTYDLELEERGQGLVPTGGEWQQNNHPDFLWVPTRGSIARTDFDNVDLQFTGNGAPAKLVTDMAMLASKGGYPLCQTVRELIKRSTGVDSYVCQ